MRPFLTACLVALVISIGAMAILDLIQEPVSTAFATTEVRI
jgi:hypothetical protein